MTMASLGSGKEASCQEACVGERKVSRGQPAYRQSPLAFPRIPKNGTGIREFMKD